MADQDRWRVDRRGFLCAAVVAPFAARAVFAAANWRVFEVVVHVTVREATGPTIVWLPRPSSTLLPDAQRVDAAEWHSTTQKGRTATVDPATLSAAWDAGTEARELTLTMRVATRDCIVDLTRPARPRPSLSTAERRHYLRATRLLPTDGIVRATAEKIVRHERQPLARARAIYEWIVENTFRDPAVKGCGTGDIRWMLETGSLGGKCADLNALFVALCRSLDLPARDLYGLRVAPSASYRSLGRFGDVTGAQHCRAQVFIDDYGWVPVDPADVRKVVLEEQPGGQLTDAAAVRAHRDFFGAWEMNWIAFNDLHDVALPGARGKPLPFFMYPQAEVDGTRRDSLDAGRFAYRITAKELL
jgi:transglutaminase-like putative cysteine protease